MSLIKGAMTALITPFDEVGNIDMAAFRGIVSWQVEEGIDGLVVCGSTGEASTMSPAERMEVIKNCVDTVNGRVPVIAGISSNSTKDVIAIAREIKDAGADAVLLATPYYNKPTQEGIFQHFKMLNDAVDIPIVVYDIPGRCVIRISDDNLIKISGLKNVIAVKDATGDIVRIMNIKDKIRSDVVLLSGDDPTSIPFNIYGGQGCISVVSNVIPKKFAEMQELCIAGNFTKAQNINDEIYPLWDAMGVEANPIPVKYAVSLLGKCKDVMRMPLTNATQGTMKAVKEAMSSVGL